MQLLGELVEVRKQIAQANGYANYLEYANNEKGRYSYGEAELTQLCQMVRQELVPLKQQLYERLRNRLGGAVYTADDTGIMKGNQPIYPVERYVTIGKNDI